MAKWTTQSTERDIAEFSDDPRVKAALRKRRRRISISILICLSIIGLCARPSYRYVREMLINRNLEGARAAVRLEDWGTARNLARSVLIARSGDYEALQIWFHALSHLGEARTYIVAAGIFVDARASRTDRLDALKVLALQAPQAVAFSAYASLPKDMQQEPAAIAALAPLLTFRGEVTIVEKVLRAVPPEAKTPAIRLELLRSLCVHPTPERIGEARALFVELIEAKLPVPALEALNILGETPGGLDPGEPLPSLPDWVNLQPKATTLHHLLALHPQLKAARSSPDAIIQGAIDRFLGVDPGTLGTWLIRHNQSARAVELLAEPAKTSPTAYVARLHALIREKNTDELAIAMNQAPASCDPVELELIKVAAARLRKDPAAESVAWNQALDRAALDQTRNRFLELVKYAEMLNVPKVYEDAWVAAIRFGWGQIPLYQDLRKVFGSLAAQSRSEDMLAMCSTLLRFEPQNAELLCNYYYLALLHGVATPAAIVKQLEELTAANPEATDFVPALTTAYLMADQPAAALQKIKVMKGSKRVTPLACQILEACALLLTGDTEAGTRLLKNINWDSFMSAESVAFRNLLNRPKFKDLALPELKPVVALDAESIPAWRKAIERFEKDRKGDVLPALPVPKIPGSDRPDAGPIKE